MLHKTFVSDRRKIIWVLIFVENRTLSGSRIRVTFARPRTRGRGQRGYDPNMRCYQCGERGHFSRDCPDTKYGYKRPPSRYVTYCVDLNEGNLFQCVFFYTVKYSTVPYQLLQYHWFILLWNSHRSSSMQLWVISIYKGNQKVSCSGVEVTRSSRIGHMSHLKFISFKAHVCTKHSFMWMWIVFFMIFLKICEM